MGCPRPHLLLKLPNFRALLHAFCMLYHLLIAFPEFRLQPHSWHSSAMPVNSLRAGRDGAVVPSAEPGVTPQHLPSFNSELIEVHHGKCSPWWWWRLLFFSFPVPSLTFLWDPWTRDVRLTESKLSWCIPRKKLLSSQPSRTQLSAAILDLHLGKTQRLNLATVKCQFN